jgi:uncharacterized phage protein gp47/JayE
MPTYGLTSAGFVAEPLAQVQTDLQAALQAQFGADIDLSASGPFGQLVGILAEREAALWQLAQATYGAAYPDTASSAALDDVASVTGCIRLAATKSLDYIVGAGTNGTVVPSGTVFASSPSSNSFASSAAATIATLSAWAATTGYSAFSAIAAGSLVTNGGNIYACTVAGTSAGSGGPTGTGTAIVDGGCTWRYVAAGGAAVGIPVQGGTTGPLVAPAGTMTSISTPVAGLTSVMNPIDAMPGRAIETDAALRVRRAALLQQAGSAPVNALRAALLKVSGVTAAYVYENPLDVADGNGRPPHSVECVVQGGTAAAVALAIWQNKAAGANTTGTTSQGVTDPATGTAYTVSFTVPTAVPIYVAVTVKKGSTYVTGGVGSAAVQAAVVAYANGTIAALGNTTYVVGQTVYANPLIAAVLDQLPPPMVLDVPTMNIGLSASPTGNAPLTMAYNQLPSFQTSQVAVTET